MIRIATLLVILTIATSVPYKNFTDSVKTCSSTHIKTCIPEFFKNPAAMGPQEIECAKSYSQARVCFSNYKQCFPPSVGQQSKQMPLVCWNCYMDIDTDSLKYNKFTECLKANSAQFLTLWIMAIMLLVLYQ